MLINHYQAAPLRGARPVVVCILAACALLLHGVAEAQNAQLLSGHLPPASSLPLRRLEADRTLKIAIGLPLRNRDYLSNLIGQLYDPASRQYRHYLTPGQFTEAFGPSARDYESVVNYARSNGLKVTGTHPNRMLVEAEGAAAQVEQAFGVTLHWYQHPTENRLYYAPSGEPSIRLATPVLRVNGLDNYSIPHPHFQRSAPGSGAVPQAGSGIGASFLGYDFRNAYLPNVALTGAGQSVGLFELSGYYAVDISNYATQAGLSEVPLSNVLVGGFNGAPDPDANAEVALDIEMAMSMAPGLSQILVYEGSTDAGLSVVNAVLNRMATDNLARQLSCSWGFDIDTLTEQIFLQYAIQGQSFLLASGDTGAFAGPVEQPSDSPYATVVGGTVLTTSSSQSWLAETAWNNSSGGISTLVPIPWWQLGVATAANFASTTMRNTPDVAMVAQNVQVNADDGETFSANGTSIAAPLWAGLTALANERAADLGKPPVGFLNPMLYAIGRNSTPGCFHDITSGNNYNSGSPNLYPAVAGYDLCTGWGTPAGTNLIEALMGAPNEPLVISAPTGFIAEGPVGGPFSGSTQTFFLANASAAALNWSVISTSALLNVSSTAGVLAPGASAAAVTVSLQTNAVNLTLGQYSASVSFVDNTTGVAQVRQFNLLIGNGGFETGDFSDWSFSGQSDGNFPISIDWSNITGEVLIPGVADVAFVHSGIYGAFLGQNKRLGYLSQQLPTQPGQSYVLSFWLSNPATGVPNEFRALWNGAILYDGTSLNAFDWTNYQFVVTASNTTTTLQFGFRNDENAFGLDDITLQPVLAPSIQSVQTADGGVSFAWNTTAGATYQVQYTDNLQTLVWTALGAPVQATGPTLSASDTPQESQRFYRVIVQ